ncbi:MAG: dihydropteroate synthase [Methanosarcinales archaeon]
MAINVSISGLRVGDHHPARIMGVLNLSRESFYKESVVEPDLLIETAEQMIKDGADLIDIGGRSTWPLAEQITTREEERRVIPALKILRDRVNIPISIDTMHSKIAKEALDIGADLINDVSGFTHDKDMKHIAARYDCPVILMASRKEPGDITGINETLDALSEIIQVAEAAGVKGERIIIDPAIGQWHEGRGTEEDIEVINNLKRLKPLKKPILIALSRKSFIGNILKKPPKERLHGSLAATAIAIYNGAHIIRTHDVAATRDAVRMAERLRQGKKPRIKE